MGGKHGVVRVDMRGLSGGDFNGVHFLFAALLIERAYHDGLSYLEVPCTTQLYLRAAM